MRSSTTAMWWKTCAPRARCSSTSSRTPAGAIVVFSAHGVSQAVRAEADARGLQVFDATCPLVTKVHIEVSRMRAAGREIIMIGHKGHPEVEGTLGQAQGGMYRSRPSRTWPACRWPIPTTGLCHADHAVGG